MWTRFGLLQKEKVAFGLRNQFSASGYRLLLLKVHGGAITRSFSPNDVNTNTDKITITGHGLETGTRVTFSVDSGGSLPGGIVADTPYYLVRHNADEISLVESFSDFLITLDQIANNQTLNKLVDLTSQGSGSFTLTVRQQVGSDDFMAHAARWETTGGGYTRKQFTVPEPTFGNPNNRVNFPAVSIVVNASGGDIQYTHIALAANAGDTIGNSIGILLGVEYTGALQTIPDGFGFTFIISLASPAVAFNTAGIN